MQMSSREEFEAWHKTEVANFVSAGQMQAARVLTDFKQTALAIWEASRVAVVIELPEHYFYESPGEVHPLIQGCREAIEAAGLKVKS